MSLRSLAAQDSARFISRDGDEITISLPGPPPLDCTLPGLPTSTGAAVDAEGLPLYGDFATVTISLQTLTEKGANYDDLKKPGVTVTSLGVQYRIDRPLPDKTLDRVTILLKRLAAT